jgi:hypothetical protein
MRNSDERDGIAVERTCGVSYAGSCKERIEEHAREGLPMYVWRDGKVVAVRAEELLEKS